MKRIILISYLLFSFCFLSNTQAQSKQLTMREAVIGQWQEFYPQDLYNLSWRADGDKYVYVKQNKVFTASPKESPKMILTLDEFNKFLSESHLKPLRYFPAFHWVSADVVQLFSDKHLIQFNVKTKKIVFTLSYNPKAKNEKFCDQNNTIAYSIDNNLYIQNASGKEIAITKDKDKNMVYGQLVSRSEYGINGGIFWSPKGKNLAFYKKDESKVGTFPLVDINTRAGKLREIKYPMAGMSSEVVSLGVYNLSKKTTLWINPKDFGKNQYLTNISWGGNGRYIYIQVLNRASNHMKLNKYDALTGAFVKTLFEERDSRWVEPQHKLIALKKKPNQFIYQSDKDGYNHIYLYKNNGKLIKQLTKGNWSVTKVLGFDKEDKNIFYLSTQRSPLDRDAYKLNLKTGKKTRLTNKQGVHTVEVRKDGKYILDNYSSLHIPRIINIANSKGGVIKNLVTATNKLKEYNLGEITLGKIKAADNKTDLYYRMIKPANFNPNKKYPVVVYVYGGPHAQLVTNKWMGGARLWEEYMAEQGYLLFILDNRGSANRGKEFEAVIHRQCGQVEMKDQIKGVQFLKSLAYVDANRIGVHGWSYGGFMTISLMTNYPDVFKVAVAGGPVIDWKWYEVMYGERYMDTPQENPEGYAKTSLLNKAKDLKGKLLICQGAVDKTVLWINSLSFVRECIKNNVQVDYFPYPRSEHNVRGYDRIHLMQKVTNYFNDYLK